MLPSLHPTTHLTPLTPTCAFGAAGAHISAALPAQTNSNSSKFCVSLLQKQRTLLGWKSRNPEPSAIGGYTGVNAPAGGSKKLIPLDLKRESLGARFGSTASTTNCGWRGNRGRTESVYRSVESSVSWLKCLGTSVDETMTEKVSLDAPPVFSSSVVEVWLHVKLRVLLK